ncbi:hypothetical protein Hanom_Chr05g00473661 [Helianthus anomalus]
MNKQSKSCRGFDQLGEDIRAAKSNSYKKKKERYCLEILPPGSVHVSDCEKKVE